MPALRPRAYSISDPTLPWTRATLYRWESLGLIKLVRVGGKTLLTDETYDDILAGRVAIPQHASRKHHFEPKVRPHRQPKGRG
jgi:hypothetical protein